MEERRRECVAARDTAQQRARAHTHMLSLSHTHKHTNTQTQTHTQTQTQLEASAGGASLQAEGHTGILRTSSEAASARAKALTSWRLCSTCVTTSASNRRTYAWLTFPSSSSCAGRSRVRCAGGP
eukprot:33077-Rhodomonas_salina.3